MAGILDYDDDLLLLNIKAGDSAYNRLPRGDKYCVCIWNDVTFSSGLFFVVKLGSLVWEAIVLEKSYISVVAILL